jgi:hypothetical protein
MFEDPSGLTNWTRQPLRQEICSLVVGARESPSGFPEVLDEAGGDGITTDAEHNGERISNFIPLGQRSPPSWPRPRDIIA